MNSVVEILNRWGEQFLSFAWPMFWQSTLLIAVVFAIEFALRRKVRAAIRHALWLVVLVKLMLPPTLALPTGPSWWIHSPAPPPPTVKASPAAFTVTYGEQVTTMPDFPQVPAPIVPQKAPFLKPAAWTLVLCGIVSGGLLSWLLLRWRQVHRRVRRANASGTVQSIMGEAQSLAQSHPGIRLKLTEDTMSPAVCGLFRPVVLLPRSLVEKLSAEQLRAVLLHELIHVRRGDVWVNCAQALLQIVYWWHPLLWLANARIRRVREEAVDDAVMLALRDDAEIYAPTLLEVAKFAFRRPLASLGLIGILESRSALRQRIERLMDFHAPRKAGLTAVSILGIVAFSAAALPMGQAPETTNAPVADNTVPPRIETFKLSRPMDPEVFQKHLLPEGLKIPPTVVIPAINGFILVRGSEDQLALMRQTVLKLNGFPSNESNAISEPSTTSRTRNVASTSTNLQMRVFKVDRNMFASTLRSTPGIQNGDVPTMVKQLLDKLGVDLAAPGRSLAFDGLGLLFVKATSSEIDTVERTVQALNFWEPQIHIKGRFFEVPEGQMEEILKAGTPVDSKQTNLVEIIAADKMQPLLRQLESSSGVKSLAEPEAVTTSLRQVQVRSDNATVDLAPALLSDAYTLILQTIVSKPGNWIAQADIWDGQTMALVFPANSSGLNRLVIFMTCSVIDPAGNRVHSDEELRLIQEKAKSDIPPQHTLILSDTNSRATLHALEQRAGVETLAEPGPVSTAGRQVQQMRADYVLQQPQYASAGREAIFRKLNSIRLESVMWSNAITLSEALRFLAEQSRLHDPDKKGVNFSFNPNARWAAAPDIDPATGMPVATAPASEIVDIKSITVRLTMKDVSLNDLLDAMVLSADHPIKYSVQDYGVVISPHDPAQLETRVFKEPKVAVNFPITSFRGVVMGTNHIDFADTNLTADEITTFFEPFGVHLDGPGKSVAFNGKLSLLFVKSTPAELDAVERILQMLMRASPQIHIKARFIEVPKAGFVALPQWSSNAAAGQLTGILTDPELRTLLRDLEYRPGVEMLAEPECVSTSGRQTMMRATDVVEILTNSTIVQTTNNSTAFAPQTKKFEIGPKVDLVTRVLDDGYTINLTATAEVLDFLGYDIATNRIYATNSIGREISAPTPKPGFRNQTGQATVYLWDNQTLVLGNLKSDFLDGNGQPGNESKFLEEAEKKNGTADKELLVFITTTIVDPAGNRVHSDDQLPFNPSTIPPQPH